MTNSWVLDTPPLTAEEMLALLEWREQPGGPGRSVMRLFPLACPSRAALLERALDGDPVALQTVILGTSRIVALRRMAEESVTRHGDHNQKSHGRRGPGSGDLPDGWESEGFGAPGLPAPAGTRVSLRSDDGTLLASVSVADRVVANPWGEFESRSGEVATEVAGYLDPLVRADGLTGLMVRVVDPVEMMDENTTGQTSGEPGRRSSIMELNARMWTDPSWVEEGARESIASGWMPPVAGVNPRRYVVTHETGHAVANARAYDMGAKAWSKAKWPMSNDRIMPEVRKHTGDPDLKVAGGDIYSTLAAGRVLNRAPGVTVEAMKGSYGLTHPAEMYAEAYAQFHLRDTAPEGATFPWAQPLAASEGWAALSLHPIKQYREEEARLEEEIESFPTVPAWAESEDDGT